MGEPDAVAHAVGKVLRVPDRYRKFTARPDQVHRVYRIEPDLLQRLRDLGLPARRVGGEDRFDPFDLTNVALSLRLPCPRYVAMRWWPRALETTGDRATVRYRVGVRSQCHDPDRCDDCQVELSPLLRAAANDLVDAPARHIDAEFSVGVRGGRHFIPPAYRALFTPLAPVEWHLLPAELSYDLGFLRDAGLADCILAATYLTDAARRVGLRARTSFGLLVAPPFSSAHYWTEFSCDGQWLPADPLLLTSLTRWGLLDPLRWPAHRSPLGMMWRLHDGETPLVTHDGTSAKVVLPTALL